MQQHANYGPFVRIAPNHISITDPATLMQIYGGKAGFLKGPFYEDRSPPQSLTVRLTITYHSIRWNQCFSLQEMQISITESGSI